MPMKFRGHNSSVEGDRAFVCHGCFKARPAGCWKFLDKIICMRYRLVFGKIEHLSNCPQIITYMSAIKCAKRTPLSHRSTLLSCGISYLLIE